MASIEIDITKPFELRGKWWLPDHNSNQIFGTLRFDPAGDFVLELDGWLDPTRRPGSSAFLYPPVVHGLTKEGKHCSLLEVFESNFTIGSGIPSSKLTVNFAIVGALTTSLENLQCQSASIRYTNLEAWVSRSRLWEKIDKGGKKSGRSFAIEYKEPKSVKYSVTSIQSTVTLESALTGNYEPCVGTLRHTESIRIRPRRRQPLVWFIDQAHHLRNLLALFATERFFYRAFKVQLGRRKLPNMGGRQLRVEADLIMRQGYFSEVRQLYGHDLPFPHPVVRRDLPRIIEVWFNEREQLKPVHDLFFGSFYNRELGIEFQFLSLIQALESLHRRFHKGRYISKKKCDSCRQILTGAIPTSVPKDLRTALKNRIQYGNEYSLRKRLTLMGRQLNSSSRQLIANDFKRFVTAVVDTRNYLTHYDPSPGADIMDTKEMIVATFSLRLLLTLYLFKRIGMQESAIAKVMKEHRRFQKPEIRS